MGGGKGGGETGKPERRGASKAREKRNPRGEEDQDQGEEKGG